MKKIIIFILITALSANSQVKPDENGKCPEGYHLAWINTWDGMNLHRPKHNCKKGFWLCKINESGWHAECVKNGYASAEDELSDEAKLVNNQATVKVELLNTDSVLFRFPIGLKTLPSYEGDVLKTLNVDDELTFDFNGTTYKLILGDYLTFEKGNEIRVIVKVVRL